MTADPQRRLVFVFCGLMVLLAATIGTAYLPLGGWGLAVALAIAGAKAGLVLAFFMGLSERSGLVRLFAASGAYWLALLFLLTFLDILTRGG